MVRPISDARRYSSEKVSPSISWKSAAETSIAADTQVQDHIHGIYPFGKKCQIPGEHLCRIRISSKPVWSRKEIEMFNNRFIAVIGIGSLLLGTFAALVPPAQAAESAQAMTFHAHAPGV